MNGKSFSYSLDPASVFGIMCSVETNTCLPRILNCLVYVRLGNHLDKVQINLRATRLMIISVKGSHSLQLLWQRSTNYQIIGKITGPQ